MEETPHNLTKVEKFFLWCQNHWLISLIIILCIILISFSNVIDAVRKIYIFSHSESPIHITEVDFAKYEAGKSVAVNVHYSNTKPLLMTQGDVALLYYQLPEKTNWASDRFQFEDKYWESFQQNGIKDIKVSPLLNAPTGQNLYFTIQGVTLSSDMINLLRAGKAVIYYAVTMKYEGGSVDLCGFGQSDTGATFLCHDHNTI